MQTKEITKIRLENLKDAEYIVVMLKNSYGTLSNEISFHTFTEILDIMLETNDIDEAAERIDIPIGSQLIVTDNFEVDINKTQEEPMIIMRVK